MNTYEKREQKPWLIKIGATTLLAHCIGLLSEPLFRQLPWQQSKLVVLPYGLSCHASNHSH
jgi:hypothetical protein